MVKNDQNAMIENDGKQSKWSKMVKVIKIIKNSQSDQ